MTTIVPPDLLQTPYRKNVLINGAMQVNQRGWAGPTTSVNLGFNYVADRFVYYQSASTGVSTLTRDTDVPTLAESGYNFSTSIDVDITTALASPTGANEATILQRIEGYNIAGIIGNTVTFSFWVKSNKTGIYSVSVRNEAGNRTYVTEFTIDASATWEKKIITFPFDNIGTWNTTNGYGLQVSLGLMSASGQMTSTLDEWHTTVGDGYSTNQVNIFDSTANYFKTTGWQVEKGDVATEFERRSYGEELALCQRYFYAAETAGASGYASAGSQTERALCALIFPTVMRTAPAISTATVTGTTGGNTSGSVPGSINVDKTGNILSATAAAAGSIYWRLTSGFISYDAEL